MKYKVVFKGGASGDKVEERVVEAVTITVHEGMTSLMGQGYVALVIPNDRVISVEKIA